MRLQFFLKGLMAAIANAWVPQKDQPLLQQVNWSVLVVPKQMKDFKENQ